MAAKIPASLRITAADNERIQAVALFCRRDRSQIIRFCVEAVAPKIKRSIPDQLMRDIKSVHVPIRFPQELLDVVATKATACGVSGTEIIQHCMDVHLPIIEQEMKTSVRILP